MTWRLPKVHLHVHVESAIRPATLREIGAANGVPVPSGPGNGPLAWREPRRLRAVPTLPISPSRKWVRATSAAA